MSSLVFFCTGFPLVSEFSIYVADAKHFLKVCKPGFGALRVKVLDSPGSEVIKLFFMLNSAEHEILNARKYKNI